MRRIAPTFALTALLILLVGAPAAHAAAGQPATLKEGSRGAAVRALEGRLADLGYLGRGEVDGYYSAETAQGVMAFQGWERLSRDGVAGPKTRHALDTATRPTMSGHGRRIVVLRDRQVALLIGADGTVKRTIHVSTGAPGRSTPAGSFKVYRKELRSWSHPFHVWLPFASYFTGGIAFHEYPSVPGYAASHGCVRVPAADAPTVYRFAAMGTPVTVR